MTDRARGLGAICDRGDRGRVYWSLAKNRRGRSQEGLGSRREVQKNTPLLSDSKCLYMWDDKARFLSVADVFDILLDDSETKPKERKTSKFCSIRKEFKLVTIYDTIITFQTL